MRKQALVNFQRVKKFEGPAHPKGRNLVSQKMQFGWVNMSAYNFLFVDQSSPSFFRPTWAWL